MKAGFRPWLVIFLLLLMVQAGNASAAQINVVWTSEVGQFAPLWITKEAKLFEKYGNQVQLIFIQGASSAAAALISGDAQVGMFSPQVVIETTMKGWILRCSAALATVWITASGFIDKLTQEYKVK